MSEEAEIPSIPEATVFDMLYIGNGCGLIMVDEAYANFLSHYDAFFPIANNKLPEAINKFNCKVIEAGLTETQEVDGKQKTFMREESILDAAKRLGYDLSEKGLPEKEALGLQEVSDEDFDF